MRMPLDFDLNDKNRLKVNSLKNIRLILQNNSNIKSLFAYNEFTNLIEVTRSVPELQIDEGPMMDEYVGALQEFIDDQYHVVFNEKQLNTAIVNEARRNHYNPVKDYLDDCHDQWDGESRIADVLPDYLGAPRTDVTTLITELWFVGAVAKVYEPKVKFDFVLDLAGDQGTGKTTFLKQILPNEKYYDDQISSFEDRDSYATMLQAWIVNDDEMKVSEKASFASLKKFITTEVLEYRKPYGTRTETRPKNFVIARTTNEPAYLRDKTGERRFLPIRCNKDNRTKIAMTGIDPQWRAQFWGEVVDLYRSGFTFVLTDEQAEAMEEHRAGFMYQDQVEIDVLEYIESIDDDFVTSAQIGKALGVANLVTNKRLSSKIKYVMDNKHNWEYCTKTINGKSKRGYKRIH